MSASETDSVGLVPVSTPHAQKSIPHQLAAAITRLARAHAGRVVVACIGLALLASFGGGTPPVDGTSGEYKLKAAFVYNFTKYVKWPDRAFAHDNDPIVVAVLGQDPFKGELDDALRDKTIGTHKLVVQRFKTFDDLAPCHLLFVPATEASKLPKIREHYENSTTLLVGESDRFAARGGAIGFYIQDKKVRFEINPAATARAGVEVSSQLLKLARVVKEEG